MKFENLQNLHMLATDGVHTDLHIYIPKPNESTIVKRSVHSVLFWTSKFRINMNKFDLPNNPVQDGFHLILNDFDEYLVEEMMNLIYSGSANVVESDFGEFCTLLELFDFPTYEIKMEDRKIGINEVTGGKENSAKIEDPIEAIKLEEVEIVSIKNMFHDIFNEKSDSTRKCATAEDVLTHFEKSPGSFKVKDVKENFQNGDKSKSTKIENPLKNMSREIFNEPKLKKVKWFKKRILPTSKPLPTDRLPSKLDVIHCIQFHHEKPGIVKDTAMLNTASDLIELRKRLGRESKSFESIATIVRNLYVRASQIGISFEPRSWHDPEPFNFSLDAKRHVKPKVEWLRFSAS